MLRPAVLAYMRQTTVPGSPPMTDEQIRILRAYLKQWIDAPGWSGPMIDVLRTMVDEITTFEEIERWCEKAMAEWIDPL